MKPTMFFLMNSIALQRGGLTRASLKQASLFAELGYETYMLTFNFNPRYPIIRKKLLDMKKIHENVIIKNIFEDFEGFDESIASETQPPVLANLADGGVIDKRSGYNAYRIYKKGLYVKYVSFHDDNTLDFIDYFNENRYRTKREVYGFHGHLKKVIYMDFSLNKARQSVYLNNYGEAYLSEWLNPKDHSVDRINFFNKEGAIEKVYVKDNVSYKLSWLKSLIEEEKNSVIISDTRSTDEILSKFNHPGAAKIWRLHSTHLDKPYEVNSNITSHVKTGFNNINTFDCVLFLTNEQKKDVVDRIGDSEKFCVIPHFHELPKKAFLKPLINKVKRDEKLSVIVSRLSTLKRIDHSIKAFEKVIEKIPDARLEIWGIGPEEDNLKKVIKDLKLEDSVSLKGYTHTPDDIYKKGLFSVLTSKNEGFALSIIESMANKTPVISYKIKYGPNEMIQSMENGILIEDNNIDKLANSMIYCFENPGETQNMGEKANKFIEKNFSKELYKRKWLQAIDTAIVNSHSEKK